MPEPATRVRSHRVRSPFTGNPLEYVGRAELGVAGLWALALAVWSLAAALAGGFL